MQHATLKRPVEILLAEDSPSDVHLTKRALAESGIRTRLTVAADGVEVMEYLRQEGGGTSSRPHLIVLDLNMPRMNGFEVLEELKSDPQLRHIPVVVLTTSDSDDDILRCYRAQANCYVIKPADIERFFEAIRAIEEFWLGCCRLPGE